MTKQFWTSLESTFGVQIPIYVQNIMNEMGYDNPISFQKITPAKLEEIETLVRRSINFSPLLDDPREECFSIFIDNEGKHFSFKPGDRDLILGLVERVKEYSQVFKKLLNY